ncbi:MAG: hypothetical protein AB8B87_20470 [Granulosicoccus sp.]
MKINCTLKLVKRSFLSIAVLLIFAGPAVAKMTINPVDLTIDGGYTFNSGVSDTTSLFVDVGQRRKENKFWVRVDINPGVPSTNESAPESVPVTPSPLASPIEVYIKYFPISRYVEVREAMRGIRNYGTVNPYVEGFVICDAPNSTIRLWRKKVVMAYNCGSDRPDADDSTFKSEELLKMLRQETLAEPDLQGLIPQ